MNLSTCKLKLVSGAFILGENVLWAICSMNHKGDFSLSSCLFFYQLFYVKLLKYLILFFFVSLFLAWWSLRKKKCQIQWKRNEREVTGPDESWDSGKIIPPFSACLVPFLMAKACWRNEPYLIFTNYKTVIWICFLSLFLQLLSVIRVIPLIKLRKIWLVLYE